MRPHTTIRNLLVHRKDKVNTEETAECVYRIPCKNCQKESDDKEEDREEKDHGLHDTLYSPPGQEDSILHPRGVQHVDPADQR